MTSFRVHYCVPPENQYLIAEVYADKEHWAELNTEAGQLQIVFFPRSEPLMLPYDEAMAALREAAAGLRRRSVFFGK
jgi:hypothetical protein